MKYGVTRDQEVYGWELILNLYDCDSQFFSSEKELVAFVGKLCEVIKVRRYGKPLIKRFGKENTKTFGYSLVQLIETSSITIHISEQR